MFRHDPSSLTGPITRERAWWLAEDDDPTLSSPTQESDDRPFRADLVERVRREIAAGTYDTPEKWDAALDRLLRRMEEE